MERKRSFLVVDDSYIDRLVCGMLIKRTFENPEVSEVIGGKQALDWLQSRSFSDDQELLILLDIMMPQMNGFEFLDEFEKLDTNLKNKTTVIMLSSTLDHEDIARARNHSAVKRLLSKPLSANELRDCI